jgi:hypothetical protein
LSFSSRYIFFKRRLSSSSSFMRDIMDTSIPPPAEFWSLHIKPLPLENITSHAFAYRERFPLEPHTHASVTDQFQKTWIENIRLPSYQLIKYYDSCLNLQ